MFSGISHFHVRFVHYFVHRFRGEVVRTVGRSNARRRRFIVGTPLRSSIGTNSSFISSLTVQIDYPKSDGGVAADRAPI